MSSSISDANSDLENRSSQSEVSTAAEHVEEPRFSAAELAASGALDALFEQIDSGEVQLSGDGGLLPELIKAVLERGLQAEMTGHLGYEKGDPSAGLDQLGEEPAITGELHLPGINLLEQAVQGSGGGKISSRKLRLRRAGSFCQEIRLIRILDSFK